MYIATEIECAFLVAFIAYFVGGEITFNSRGRCNGAGWQNKVVFCKVVQFLDKLPRILRRNKELNAQTKVCDTRMDGRVAESVTHAYRLGGIGR